VCVSSPWTFSSRQLTTICAAEIIAAFLNSTLECPLPVEGLAALSEVLGICASTKDVVTGDGEEENSKGAVVSSDDAEATGEVHDSVANNAGKILGLLSACEAALSRAENADNGEFVANNISATVPAPVTAPSSTAPLPARYEPLLPPSVTEHFHDAMHDALMKVMAERDESLAQLIASNVLHVHELEQERKKNDNMTIHLEVANALALAKPNVPQLFMNFPGVGDKPKQDAQAKLHQVKIQNFELQVQNSDAQVIALCQQLAGEISAKTAATLEIIRLKEGRDIERKTAAAEKQALKDELKRVKQLLAEHQHEKDEARRESDNWKQSDDNLVATQRNGTSSPSN
jgi:hypothetical protein